MGGSTSIMEKSEQDTSNRITQISNESCVNACVIGGNNTVINISNTTIRGDINYSSACIISGAGCTLKASLDSALLNTQTSQQDASISEEEDPFTLLNQLFDIGSSDNISESNFQSISNEITQIMNSTCQNNQEISNNDLTLFLSNDDIEGSVNLTASGSITNTQCILNNMSKSYVKNDQSNSQKASISKGSCLAGLGGLGGILILFIIMKLFHSNHGQTQKKPGKKQGENSKKENSKKEK